MPHLRIKLLRAFPPFPGDVALHGTRPISVHLHRPVRPVTLSKANKLWALIITMATPNSPEPLPSRRLPPPCVQMSSFPICSTTTACQKTSSRTMGSCWCPNCSPASSPRSARLTSRTPATTLKQSLDRTLQSSDLDAHPALHLGQSGRLEAQCPASNLRLQRPGTLLYGNFADFVHAKTVPTHPLLVCAPARQRRVTRTLRIHVLTQCASI